MPVNMGGTVELSFAPWMGRSFFIVFGAILTFDDPGEGQELSWGL